MDAAGSERESGHVYRAKTKLTDCFERRTPASSSEASEFLEESVSVELCSPRRRRSLFEVSRLSSESALVPSSDSEAEDWRWRGMQVACLGHRGIRLGGRHSISSVGRN